MFDLSTLRLSNREEWRLVRTDWRKIVPGTSLVHGHRDWSWFRWRNQFQCESVKWGTPKALPSIL